MIYPKVVVLCTNSEGAPEFYTHAPTVTQDELAAGRHYDLAKEHAARQGYSEPMIAFDETDPAARRMAQVLRWQSPSASGEYERVREGIASAAEDWPHNEYWPPEIAERIRAIAPTPAPAIVPRPRG